MTALRKAQRFCVFVSLLFAIMLPLIACGETPPQIPLKFDLEVSPGTEVEEGKGVAIVANIEPLVALNLEWSVSGTAEGQLNTTTGDQVIYTAGKEGTDVVIAEGTTANGDPVKHTVTLTVVNRPVAEDPAPTAPPTLSAVTLLESCDLI